MESPCRSHRRIARWGALLAALSCPLALCSFAPASVVSVPEDIALNGLFFDPFSESPVPDVMTATIEVTAPNDHTWRAVSTNPMVLVPDVCEYTGSASVLVTVDYLAPWQWPMGSLWIDDLEIPVNTGIGVTEQWCYATIEASNAVGAGGGVQQVGITHSISPGYEFECLGWPFLDTAESWITINGYNDDTLTYVVEPNNGGCRRGTLLFGNEQHTVFQEAGPASVGDWMIY
ncbi:MAG: hypothetical protein PWP23_2221 [Candidatus Sumerlaeota bacterium]|nr:hypothetical protein [Candidatus Sumerlaeota bacterium]